MKITRPDKGNGVVILDRRFYMSKSYDIVNDESNFLKLSSGPTLRREEKLQRFLRILKNKGFFTKEQYDNIYLVAHNLPEYTVPLRRT